MLLSFTGICPALIAAIASRESHVFHYDCIINEDGTNKDANNHGYGMMQVI